MLKISISTFLRAAKEKHEPKKKREKLMAEYLSMVITPVYRITCMVFILLRIGVGKKEISEPVSVRGKVHGTRLLVIAVSNSRADWQYFRH